jgi:hypothetical protein
MDERAGMRWMYPPGVLGPEQRDRFDPVLEGTRYHLGHDVSLALWTRVRADAADNAGRCNEEQARRRFHELAVRIARRGGWIGRDPGRGTRVGVELEGAPRDGWNLDEVIATAPGRDTLVAVEARRGGHANAAPVNTLERAGAAIQSAAPPAVEAAEVMRSAEHDQIVSQDSGEIIHQENAKGAQEPVRASIPAKPGPNHWVWHARNPGPMRYTVRIVDMDANGTVMASKDFQADPRCIVGVSTIHCEGE